MPPDYEEGAGVLSKPALAVKRLYDAVLVSEEEAKEMLGNMTRVEGIE